MKLVFVNIPFTGGFHFEKNFDGRWATINSFPYKVVSIGHSWNYPTKIKGWRDWDFPNQQQGVMREVSTYSKSKDDVLVSIVRNPFEILLDYYNDNWARCKEHTNSKDFQHFVDVYLNDEFNAPAFSKSMFSQLKDVDGNWLLDDSSVILKYENLQEDTQSFSNEICVEITDYDFPKSKLDWKSKYRKDQIRQLSKLWKDDLDKFGYSIEVSNKPIVKSDTSKPKIAICFSGHLRDLERTKDYWSSMVKKYDMDVYASFWDVENEEIGDTIKNFHTIHNVKIVEVDSYSNFQKSTLSLVQPTLNPPKELAPQLQEATNRFGQLPMWYKIWKANMLTKTFDIDYDIVVRARTDSFFIGNIDIDVNNMMNVPIGRNHIKSWPNSEGINDIFAYGSPKMMDYYSSTFIHMMEYLNGGYYPFPPEHFLRVHLGRIDTIVRFIPNHITITRTSLGREDEIYNNFVKNLTEERIHTSKMRFEQPTEARFTYPIKNILKF
jgi:hypothetical protein